MGRTRIHAAAACGIVLLFSPLLAGQSLEILDVQVNPANGSTVMLLEPSGWPEAEAFAVLLGGHLMAIANQDEQDWMIATFAPQPRNLWLGLNDEEVEGDFVWTSGQPTFYLNWAAGEPNNAGGAEHYAHVWTAAFPMWNDVQVSGGVLTIFGLAEIEACGVAGPSNLQCESVGSDIVLTFDNNGPYPGGIDVFRDSELVASIADPNATSFTDAGLCRGNYKYIVRGNDGAGCVAFSLLCEASHGTSRFVSQNTPLDIPNNDPVGLADTIDFADDLVITDVDVEVQITHTWLRDLDVNVTSPGGTNVTLKEYTPGQTTDVDHIDTTFDEQGVPYDETLLPTGIRLQPEGPGTMADFVGENAQGLWTLNVADLVPADAGTLDAWAVTATALDPCAITAPASLTCIPNGNDVDLAWDIGANVYTDIEVLRNGEPLVALPGDATSFTDVAPPPDFHTYEIRGIDAAVTPCCDAISDSCEAPAGITDLVWAHPDQDGGATDDEAAVLAALAANGVDAGATDTLPANLSAFDRVWVILGTYEPNHSLTFAEGTTLRDYCLNDGGRLYVSGSDVWGFDAQTPFDEVDGIDAVNSVDGGPPPDGLEDLEGLDSGQGLDLSVLSVTPYSGENAWIDHLALDDAGLIWQNAGNLDPIGAFHDGNNSGLGDFKVISTSWEFGGFGAASDQEELMGIYLEALDFVGGGNPEFKRGDADGDGMFVGLIDTLFILAFQFQGGPPPPCAEAADADGDDVIIGLIDGLYLLAFQFAGGPPPPPPGPVNCGEDDNYLLGCDDPPDVCL